MLTKTQKHVVFSIWAWGAFCLVLFLLVENTAAQYDSQGWHGFLWWVAQLVFFPVYILSEILALIGVGGSTELHYPVISILVCITLTALIFLKSLKVDD